MTLAPESAPISEVGSLDSSELNFYQLVGLQESASDTEIRERLAKELEYAAISARIRLHRQEAEERRQRLEQIQQVLLDPAARAAYDKSLHGSSAAGEGAETSGAAAKQRAEEKAGRAETRGQTTKPPTEPGEPSSTVVGSTEASRLGTKPTESENVHGSQFLAVEPTPPWLGQWRRWIVPGIIAVVAVVLIGRTIWRRPALPGVSSQPNATLPTKPGLGSGAPDASGATTQPRDTSSISPEGEQPNKTPAPSRNPVPSFRKSGDANRVKRPGHNAEARAEAEAKAKAEAEARQRLIEAERAEIDQEKRKLAEQRRALDQQRLLEEERQARLEAEQRREEERKRRQAEEQVKQLYQGPLYGELVWEGEVNGIELITIEDGLARPGRVTGHLPGVLVNVQPADAKHVSVVSAPAPSNEFKRLVLRVQGKGHMTVRVTWAVP